MKRAELSRTSHWLLSRRRPFFLDSIIQLGDQSIKHIESYIEKGQVVADLTCGWGHYSFVLADLVGAKGKVYSVDLTLKVISKIRIKVVKGGYHNIEAYASSATDLSFIKEKSVDFVFANGLLCSMAVDRQFAVDEMKRILKPTGHAYISLGATPPLGYVDEAEWDLMLRGFNVDKGGRFKEKWAVVSLKQGMKEYLITKYRLNSLFSCISIFKRIMKNTRNNDLFPLTGF
jgi:ubiquinone/menaquinone biosynthesis C-methylase UbiE